MHNDILYLSWVSQGAYWRGTLQLAQLAGCCSASVGLTFCRNKYLDLPSVQNLCLFTKKLPKVRNSTYLEDPGSQWKFICYFLVAGFPAWNAWMILNPGTLDCYHMIIASEWFNDGMGCPGEQHYSTWQLSCEAFAWVRGWEFGVWDVTSEAWISFGVARFFEL